MTALVVNMTHRQSTPGDMNILGSSKTSERWAFWSSAALAPVPPFPKADFGLHGRSVAARLWDSFLPNSGVLEHFEVGSKQHGHEVEIPIPLLQHCLCSPAGHSHPVPSVRHCHGLALQAWVIIATASLCCWRCLQQSFSSSLGWASLPCFNATHFITSSKFNFLIGSTSYLEFGPGRLCAKKKTKAEPEHHHQGTLEDTVKKGSFFDSVCTKF